MQDTALAELYEAAKQGRWGLLISLFNELPRLAAMAARYRKPSSEWSFLHQAAYFGNEEAARILIRSGANLLREAKSGETPADVAQSRGHEALANTLRVAMRHGQRLWQPVDNPELLPSSSAWGESQPRVAESLLRVAYGGAVVQIPKGAHYFVDSFERVLIGWHGTFAPPSGMDGESMV